MTKGALLGEANSATGGGGGGGGCRVGGFGDRGRGGWPCDMARRRAYTSSPDLSSDIEARGGDKGGGAKEYESGGANWSVCWGKEGALLASNSQITHVSYRIVS